MSKGNLLFKPLKVEKLEKQSGFRTILYGKIPEIKHQHYRVLKGISIGGDAPKELIRLYEYERGFRKIHNPHQWTIYIAKTGHKWYPHESITEYLLNRLGETLGVNMAESRLCFINKQLRFLSKYFLNPKNETLEHGAELYGGYLNDLSFVEDIEQNKKALEFFTLQLTKDTLKNLYPYHAEDLFKQFIEMIVYDAIIGNNDRHFYNWGIVKNINEINKPTFAPVFDTARALLWSVSEEKILAVSGSPSRKSVFLNKYVDNSTPKIGVEGKQVKNHFDLIKALNNNASFNSKDILLHMINDENANKCRELLFNEFTNLLSFERITLIDECLALRFIKLTEAMI